MSEFVNTVKFFIVENAVDAGLRKTHTEFATAIERSVSFTSTSLLNITIAENALRNGEVDGILVSPSLVGQLSVNGVNLDPASSVVGGYNLIKLSGDALCAVNTDVLGVHYAMTSTCVHPNFRAVLVIGTGPLYEDSDFEFTDLKSSILRIDDNVTIARHKHINTSPNVSCVVTDVPKNVQTTATVNHIRMLLSITFNRYHNPFTVDQKNILLNLGRTESESDLSPWSHMASRGGWEEISLELVEKVQTQIMWQQVTACGDELFFEGCSWVKDSTV
ncbi:hypothetical protein K435DRAFT_863031 [Dendrothele bispora CBS 962.96]|uniref:Uncharacterized protein n=1 Tax=Dendrothele bispora (strain CBS 962.96) TaxID=1314807 RepID=A0A4S8LR10_DENBC|nr:hypothetical protein K435DRAFT_863031 [Dendrothele bispora CBS 962.96]